MNIGSPASHCNSGSAGTSAEPSPGNHRPPFFVFGQNQHGTPHRFNDNIIAQASTTSNNTNNVSNNNSAQCDKNYAFTTPSTKNNSTSSSFNVYDKDGVPFQQQPTSLEALYYSLNANKNGSNNNSSISSIDDSSTNHNLQHPTDGTTSNNNNVTPSPSANDMEQQHIDNIANLRYIALQSPDERGFTECLGLIILESTVMKRRGKLTYTNVNNMALDIDDNQITGLDEPSMVFGGGTKDFLEEVFVHVISDKALVLEFLGGNIEAFQILNHLMNINYDWKNREMAHVMFYEVDIARDIIYDTLDIDDDAPLISPTLPTYRPPTLLSIKRAALDESALEDSRPVKKLKHVEESPLPLRGGNNTQSYGLGGGNPSSYPPNTMQPMNGGSSLNPLLNLIGNNTNLQQPSRAQLLQHVQSQQLQIEQYRLLLQQQTRYPLASLIHSQQNAATQLQLFELQSFFHQRRLLLARVTSRAHARAHAITTSLGISKSRVTSRAHTKAHAIKTSLGISKSIASRGAIAVATTTT